MINKVIAAACALLVTAVLASPRPAAAAEDAKTFLKEAIQGDIAEIQLGQLAEKQGHSKGVKDFGKTLVTDHTKAKAKASELAKKMDVKVPSEPTAEAKETYQELTKLSGKEFDEEFVDNAVKDHKKDIEKYSAQAKHGDNKKVAALADETLPVLKKHLKTAQSLEREMSR